MGIRIPSFPKAPERLAPFPDTLLIKDEGEKEEEAGNESQRQTPDYAAGEAERRSLHYDFPGDPPPGPTAGLSTAIMTSATKNALR